MSIYLELIERVENGENFYVDFEKRTIKFLLFRREHPKLFYCFGFIVLVAEEHQVSIVVLGYEGSYVLNSLTVAFEMHCFIINISKIHRIKTPPSGNMTQIVVYAVVCKPRF